MKAEETHLKGCFVLYDTLFRDERGYFFESFNAEGFYKATGVKTTFVQDNQSHSFKGVLRGLHFQTGEHAQAKLVRVLKGEVLDVAVDIRKSSPTYGQYFSIKLSEDSHTQLFVPRGFAHGFVVLSDVADFFYKCDNFYNKTAEAGILYNDPRIKINWGVDESNLIVSEKDLQLPLMEALTVAI
jgi:dTDP-4-dehydrorhamnose 3,5-epimerase